MGSFLRGYLVVAATLVVIYLLLLYVMDYFLPFLIALFFALMLDPFVTWLEWGGRVPRWLATMIGLISSFAIFGGGIFFGVLHVIAELSILSSMLPHLYLEWLERFNQLLILWNLFSDQLHPLVQESMYTQLDHLYVITGNTLNTGLRWIRVWVLEDLPRWLVIAIFTWVATYFIARDKSTIGRFLLRLLPEQWQKPVAQIEGDMLYSTIGLIKAQLLLGAFTFIVSLSGLLYLRAPLALTLSIFAAILDIIPVVGPAFLFFPWALYEMILGDFGVGVFLLLLYGCIILLRWVVQARVISDQIGLHPLATLLSLYLGLRILGIVGFIAGPMVAILLKSMLTAGLIRIAPEETQ